MRGDMDRLTKTVKLRAMEELWEDLSRAGDECPSPEWHGDVLRKRDAAVREGTDEFVPWEDAKRILQERTRLDHAEGLPFYRPNPVSRSAK
jgi:hypothetical protein